MRIEVLIGRRFLSTISLKILVGFLVFGLANGILLEKAWADEPEEGSPEYYMKLANEGDADAAYSLANAYRNGQGVTKDPVQGAKWMLEAAEKGNVDAQFQIGYMYSVGEGVQQNDAEAVKWYRKAADAGDSWGQNNLGINSTPANKS